MAVHQIAFSQLDQDKRHAIEKEHKKAEEKTKIKLTGPHDFVGVWRGRGIVGGNERTIIVPQDSLRHATA